MNDSTSRRTVTSCITTAAFRDAAGPTVTTSTPRTTSSAQKTNRPASTVATRWPAKNRGDPMEGWAAPATP